MEKKKEEKSLGKHHVLTVISSCITATSRMFYFCLQMISSGVRLDPQLQECQKPHWKRSFPDLDYALFGYDSLKGYPLATGHDPGFTHPIFLADYTSGKQTADCRYSVPAGLIVVPDVSCETSFSSKIVRNRLEMSQSLEASANVEGWCLIYWKLSSTTANVMGPMQIKNLHAI